MKLTAHVVKVAVLHEDLIPEEIRHHPTFQAFQDFWDVQWWAPRRQGMGDYKNPRSQNYRGALFQARFRKDRTYWERHDPEIFGNRSTFHPQFAKLTQPWVEKLKRDLGFTHVYIADTGVITINLPGRYRGKVRGPEGWDWTEIWNTRNS
jgi:hypothetical protein